MGNRVFADIIKNLKMSLFWIQGGPKPMTAVFIREKKEIFEVYREGGNKKTQRKRSCENEGRDSRDASRSQ